MLQVTGYYLHYLLYSARIVNIWNSLPNDVVDVNNVNQFKAHLDKFWMHQDVKFDFTADLTGIGDRGSLKISRRNFCSPFFSVSYSINRHKIL